MPQYRAAKTFKNKEFGPSPDFIVRTGMVLTMTDKDAKTLNRGKSSPLVVPYTGPTRNHDLGNAPNNKDGEGDELRKDGPTLEEYVKAGYSAENYPPTGYAEVPSPGLDEYRRKGDEGKGDEGKDPPSSDVSVKVEGARREGGAVRRSSALPAGQASRKRT